MTVALRTLDVVRLTCFGHVLHYAITNALKDHRITRVKSVSQDWTRDFRLIQVELNIEQKSLKSDVSTRWGSSYQMVKSVHTNYKAIQELFHREEHRQCRSLVPTWQDLEVLEGMIAVLEPFDKLTDVLSEESQVTVSSVLPLIIHVEQLCKSGNGDSDMVCEMKSKIKDYIKQRFSVDPGKPESAAIDRMIRVCSYLDPRYCHVSELASLERSKLVDEMILLCESDHTRRCPITCPADGSTIAARKDSRTSSLGSLLKNATARDNSSNPDSIDELSQPPAKLSSFDKISREVTQYETVTREATGHNPDQDPLEFWKKNANIFPYLSRLAKIYLCQSATSCCSERFFSLSGHIVSKKRSSYKPDMVNTLAFLAFNLKK